MSKISIFFGLLLVTLGLAFYVATGSEKVTALIPSFLGAVIILLGAVALVPKFKKHAAHGAALAGLLGILGGLGMGLKAVMSAGDIEHPLAVTEQFIMGIICVFYLILCVKSFIGARKAMKAAATTATPAPETSGSNDA
ncbi:MAG: hypothetical protein ACI9R3_000820 [Verrucomicrobiales bacterium]|jgi:hypothetical protein